MSGTRLTNPDSRLKQSEDEVRADQVTESTVSPVSAPPSGRMYYFGCNETVGHDLWTSDGRSANVYTDTPWGRDIDGALVYGPQPRRYKFRHVESDHQQQGAAKLTHEHGWTAVDFWDRSVDSRPNSHSVFVKPGAHSFEDMMAWAKAEFPWVFARLTFDVFLGQESKRAP